jgi:hypothetical protein
MIVNPPSRRATAVARPHTGTAPSRRPFSGVGFPSRSKSCHASDPPFFQPVNGESVGCVAVPAGTDAAVLSQQTYLNIHTAQFPAGEIRGQVIPAP